MYTSFFGLHEKPFAITPDPRYLFLSERHAEGLAHLLYGVTESGGFIQLTGEVGTGKTTIVRSLLEQLPDETDIALVLNPRMTPHEFLLSICEELHVPLLPDEKRSIKAIVDALNRRLLHAHAAGRRVVLIVDEAQNLSPDVLEQIRLLTNLETAKQKLLQIILIGQPELRELLGRTDLRQLAQRVTGRYHLEPLNPDETRSYISHRIQVAGGHGEIFSRAATSVIHRSAHGVPRLLNVICDRALLGAYSRERTSVNKKLAKKAVSEVAGKSVEGTVWRWLSGALAFAVLVALVATAIGVWKSIPGPVTIDTPTSNIDLPTVTTDQSREIGDGVGDQTIASQSVETQPPQAIPLQTQDSAVTDPTEDTATLQPQIPTIVSLTDALSSAAEFTDTDSSFATLLQLWGMSYNPNNGQPCEVVQAAGLRCLYEQGSWRQLVNLDRPAILSLSDADGATHQVVLSGIGSTGTAILMAGEERIESGLDQLIPLWTGEYLVLWRPAAGPGRTLAQGASGPDVLWLRRSLEQLRETPLPATRPDFFDRPLADAVRWFQASRRMQSDGIAGARTMIELNTALGLPNRQMLDTEG
ncbi:MAG: AAA family ATPase [Gammaproteobacteria bacterium]